ncbi:basic proline-rich protein-like [Cinclus cinclus]|uniref:basic proline-rich protein-like n=1 Tax=Cinclus cinclus TaxID=127875 RepID=UPI002E0DCCD3
MAPPLSRCHGGPAPRGHVTRPRAGRPPPPDAPAMLRPPGPGGCGTPEIPPGTPRQRPGLPAAPPPQPSPRQPRSARAPCPGPAAASTAATPPGPSPGLSDPLGPQPDPRTPRALSGLTDPPGPLPGSQREPSRTPGPVLSPPGPRRDPPGLSRLPRAPSGLPRSTGPVQLPPFRAASPIPHPDPPAWSPSGGWGDGGHQGWGGNSGVFSPPDPQGPSQGPMAGKTALDTRPGDAERVWGDRGPQRSR